MKKIAFVIPWYAADIPGGAEAALRGLAEHMHAAGDDVEILTTCVRRFASDWSRNYYKEGLTKVNGVPVRRFPAEKRIAAAFDRVNRKLMNDKPISRRDEVVFQMEMVNSTALYEYIAEHKDEYGVFVFTPYMFGTTYFGSAAAGEKAVLIPCFHEESYAHMEFFARRFSQVAGMIFLSAPEQELARQLYDLSHVRTAVLGTGVDVKAQGNAERFKSKYRIQEPFVLYAGRKDAGKGVGTLLEYFAQYRREHLDSRMKLVLIGGGDIEIPDDIREDVMDLGFVDAQDKYDAYAAATVFCQPSPHESFSIVIMESWLAGRPVLVSGKCAVTKNFACESGGGLYFENYDEFRSVVEFLVKHPDEAARMGNAGREYVLANFSWDTIVKRYRSFLGQVMQNE